MEGEQKCNFNINCCCNHFSFDCFEFLVTLQVENFCLAFVTSFVLFLPPPPFQLADLLVSPYPSASFRLPFINQVFFIFLCFCFQFDFKFEFSHFFNRIPHCFTAQITQWDMILYGTTTRAQNEDPVNPGTPVRFINNDVAHNDIEHDASGQWRNMQQVSAMRWYFFYKLNNPS